MSVAVSSQETQSPPAIAVRSRTVWLSWLLPLAFAPLVFRHAMNLWQSPHYQFFPLVWLTSAWLIDGRASFIHPTQPDLQTGDSQSLGRGSIVGLGIGLALLSLAVVIYSPWLAMVAAILTVLGWLAGHVVISRSVLWAWSLLWLTVPLPMGLDTRAAGLLQATTTRCASAVLDLFSVPHVRVGNMIELLDRQLFVSEACSGANSLFAMLALVAIYGVWRDRPWPMILASLLAVPVSVGLVNVVRVTVIVVMLDYWEVDLSTGWAHDFLAILLLPLLLLLAMGVDAWLMILGGPITARERLDGRKSRLTRWWNQRWGWDRRENASRQDFGDDDTDESGEDLSERQSVWVVPRRIAIAFGVVAVAQLALLVAPFTMAAESNSIRSVEQLSEESLPPEFAGWKRVEYSAMTRDHGDENGERSHAWTFQDGRAEAAVLVDYPFLGWHELSDCYQGAGWTIEQREVVNDEDGDYVLLKLQRPGGEWACVCFSIDDRRGQSLRAAATEFELKDELRSRWSRTLQMYGRSEATHQYQLFGRRHTPWTDEEVLRLRTHFTEVRQVLREELSSP